MSVASRASGRRFGGLVARLLAKASGLFCTCRRGGERACREGRLRLGGPWVLPLVGLGLQARGGGATTL